jgi:hypothetical protein
MARTEPVGGGPKGAKGFPIGDPTHARLAIGGATRSFRAGNISAAKEHEIKAKARAKLGMQGSHEGSDNYGGKGSKRRHGLHHMAHKTHSRDGR